MKGNTMIKTILGIAVLIFCLITLPSAEITACTSLLVTKGASADGSVMITYTCDGEFHPHLEFTPAADHNPGDSIEITSWGGKILGKVAQVPHTYSVVGMMNEHQLAISETTFDGREELENKDGLLEYWDLISLALQRTRTARDAIHVIADLVDTYGYRSTGETFSLADINEAWIMEMIGPGPAGKGMEWVALRIPDGYMASHANKSRIAEFPLDDTANCLYSKNVISFAVEKGYFEPKSGEPFRYCDAYCPDTPQNRRYADTRVWSIFRHAAPSQNFSSNYNRYIKGSQPYPLWIKPDKKLSVADIFALMRDHYEGTPLDMTKGVDAGPFGSTLRCRPMTWVVDSVEYGWERSISTPQTAFSFVSQSRANLPDAVGGVFWYGLDDTYTSCYVPLYCGINSIPLSYTVGTLRKFSWESAWWIFNLVANYAQLKYSYMIPEILSVQKEIEGNFLSTQSEIEKTAVALAKNDPYLMTRYLTDYSISHAEQVVNRWRELAMYLIAKYNDGYVQDSTGRARELGYPDDWLKEVVKSRPNRFQLVPK